jgi:8-amino-7-oxononanoate synthase
MMPAVTAAWSMPGKGYRLDPLKRFAGLLDDLRQRAVYRSLRSTAGADFTSNDYLALADCARMRRTLIEALQRGVPSGSGGSRLLRGNHPEHERLEEDAARFFGTERALLFGSGYAANTALLSTLPQRGDLVVYDQYVHASSHDGMKLGRASAVSFAHNDVGSAGDAIQAWRQAGGTGTPWIVVESLYSMEGDRAPLTELKVLAGRSGAFLLIDEAHATGVFGPDGRGLAAELEGSEHVLVLHTGGKALGVSGAIVTGSSILCDFLINRARPFIFATAPPPLVATALGESLRILREEPERRTRLAALAAYARQAIGERLGRSTPHSQILPIIVGESEPTLRIAEKLQSMGFDVRAIRPPTVPSGTARLRISLPLHTDERSIDGLVHAMSAAMRVDTGVLGAQL